MTGNDLIRQVAKESKITRKEMEKLMEAFSNLVNRLGPIRISLFLDGISLSLNSTSAS